MWGKNVTYAPFHDLLKETTKKFEKVIKYIN